jgi:hypothetical protein
MSREQSLPKKFTLNIVLVLSTLVLWSCGSSDEPAERPHREFRPFSDPVPTFTDEESPGTEPNNTNEPKPPTPETGQAPETEMPSFRRDQFLAIKKLFDTPPKYETQFPYNAGDAWIFETVEGIVEDSDGTKTYIYHDIQTNKVTLSSEFSNDPNLYFVKLGLGVFSIDFTITKAGHLMANNWVTLLYKQNESKAGYHLAERTKFQDFFTLNSSILSHQEHGSKIDRQQDDSFKIHLKNRDNQYVTITLGAFNADNRIQIMMTTKYSNSTNHVKVTLVRESQVGTDTPVYYPLTQREYNYASESLPQIQIADLSQIMSLDQNHNQEFKLAVNNFGLLELSTDGMARNQAERQSLLGPILENSAQAFNTIPFLFLAYQFEFGDLACESPVCPAVQPMASYGSASDKHYLVFNKNMIKTTGPKTSIEYGIGTPYMEALDQTYADITSRLYKDFNKCIPPALAPKNIALTNLSMAMVYSYQHFWIEYVKNLNNKPHLKLTDFSILDFIRDGSFGDYVSNTYAVALKSSTGIAKWDEIPANCRSVLEGRLVTLETIETYQLDVFSEAFSLPPSVFYNHYNVNEMAYQVDMIPHDTSLKTDRIHFDGMWVEKSKHFSPAKAKDSTKGLRILFVIKDFEDWVGYGMLRSARYLWRTLVFPFGSPRDIAKGLKWVRETYPTLPIKELIFMGHGFEGELHFDDKSVLTRDTVKPFLAPAAQYLGPKDDNLVVWLYSCLISRDQGVLAKKVSDVLLKNVPNGFVLSSDEVYTERLQTKLYTSNSDYRYLQGTTEGNLFIYPKDDTRIYVKKPIRYYFDSDRGIASFIQKTKRKPPPYFKKIKFQ